MKDEKTGLHRLAAVYGSLAEAEAVRTSLIVAGVDPTAVEVARAAPAGTIRFTDDFATKSFWGKLMDLASIPRHTGRPYEDAIDNGHAIVMVSPPDSALRRIVDHHRQHIGEQLVAAPQHDVPDGGGDILPKGPLDSIRELHGAGVDAKPGGGFLL